MVKKRSDQLKKENIRIHKNTIEWQKKMGLERRAFKKKQKEDQKNGMDITNNN